MYGYEEFVQVPDVTQAPLAVPEYAGVLGTEFPAPLPNGLTASVNLNLTELLGSLYRGNAERILDWKPL